MKAGESTLEAMPKVTATTEAPPVEPSEPLGKKATRKRLLRFPFGEIAEELGLLGACDLVELFASRTDGFFQYVSERVTVRIEKLEKPKAAKKGGSKR